MHKSTILKEKQISCFSDPVFSVVLQVLNNQMWPRISNKPQ